MKMLQGLLAIGLLAIALCPFQTQAGQPINPLFFGQNAWMPRQIGAAPDWPNGDLETLFPAEVKESGVKLMRYGGSAVNRIYCDPNAADQSLCDIRKAQYLEMVENMQSNSITPLLQVPISTKITGSFSVSYKLQTLSSTSISRPIPKGSCIGQSVTSQTNSLLTLTQ